MTLLSLELSEERVVSLLLFVMSGLTGTPLSEIFREVPPFIVAMLGIVLAVTFFPELALWLPRMAGLIKV